MSACIGGIIEWLTLEKRIRANKCIILRTKRMTSNTGSTKTLDVTAQCKDEGLTRSSRSGPEPK